MPILINRPSNSVPNSVQLPATPAASPATQPGIAADPSSLTSFRNQAAAEPSFSLCGCFSDLVNWINGIISKLFETLSNAAVGLVEERVTHERLVQKGDEFIDAQFVLPHGLYFPLKMFVTIQFNDRLLAIPHANVVSDFSDFKADVKGVLSGTLQEQDLGGDARLKVAVHFIRSGTHGHYFMDVWDERSMNLKSGDESRRNASASISNASEMANAIQRLTQGNQDLSRELARFLMPEPAA